jgi:DDE superfamily endonuclease
VNIQFLTDPHGELIWASPALPGPVHDLTAAREHDIVQGLTVRAIAGYAGKGYVGASGAISTPYKRNKLGLLWRLNTSNHQGNCGTGGLTQK